jgi:hypothetical protein
VFLNSYYLILSLTMPDDTPKESLFIASLPRSLSSMIYYIARVVLGLNSPSWTSDGEILNIDRFVLYPGPRNRTGIKFLVREKNPALFQSVIDFLDQVTAATGFAYKDVVQPFVISEWSGLSRFRVLRIKRNLDDVVFSMLAQGWHYPKSASSGEGDLEKLLIEGIIRADMALDSVSGEHVDFDDLIVDESALRNALSRLYPSVALQEFKYTESFHTTADAVIKRRSTDPYKILSEKVEKLAQSIRQ